MLLFKITATVLALGVSATCAQAQVACANRTELIKLLDEKYHEASTGYGTVGETSVIEVFASVKGTFTILSTQGNGISCIIATGQNWEELGPPKKITSL